MAIFILLLKVMEFIKLSQNKMIKLLYIASIATLVLACNNSNKNNAVLAPILAAKEIKQTPLEKSMARGAVVYTNFCSQCHRPNGKGVAKNFPPLAGSNWLTNKRIESIKSVKYGLKGEITVNGVPYNGVMSPLGLSDEEVADVLNYSMNSWGNSQKKMVTVKEVKTVKK
jgi:mono/diheme cytochrome c family protein